MIKKYSVRLGSVLDGEGIGRVGSELRYRHLYCLGSTGRGKTSFLISIIEQEIDYGAFIILDPLGGLANAVASIAPKDRLIYVCKDRPIVINPLRKYNLSVSQRADELKQVINAVVRAGYSSVDITAKMAKAIRHSLEVLPQESLDLQFLHDFLLFPKIRSLYAKGDFWEVFERENKKIDTTGSIVDRISSFLGDEIKPFVIGENEFDIKRIAEGKKIVCFDLHNFEEEGMAFIGNLVSHSIKSYYMHEAVRKVSPILYFYVDECQNFITPFFEKVLAQGRQFNVSVNLSHQTLSQVKDKNLLRVLLDNSVVKVIFKCERSEVRHIKEILGVSDMDIMNLEERQAYASIDGYVKKIRTFYMLEPEPYKIEPIIRETVTPTVSDKVEASIELVEETEELLGSENMERQRPPVFFLRDVWFPF